MSKLCGDEPGGVAVGKKSVSLDPVDRYASFSRWNCCWRSLSSANMAGTSLAFALATCRVNMKTARVARMPMIATTIISSIRVNPACRRLPPIPARQHCKQDAAN